MADKLTLEFETRTLMGKKVNRLRRDGIIPATVYGKNVGPFAVQINARRFADVLRKAGKTALVEVDVPGQPTGSAFIHAIQIHPVTRVITHADLLVVDLKVEVTVDIPVHLIGESPLVKSGDAVLNHLLTTISVRALPNDIPPAVEADISILDSLDKNVHVSDIALPGKGIILTNGEDIVASITPAREEEVTPAAEGETPTEPELVREDREDGESA